MKLELRFDNKHVLGLTVTGILVLNLKLRSNFGQEFIEANVNLAGNINNAEKNINFQNVEDGYLPSRMRFN